ncbi:MAG: hypothetical protein ACKVIA_13760 [Rhodobacterales bacterium]|tara:strand:- start:1318 stop:1734 length:417 start_codon:yes stop_codon:yes gene_type:complete
MNIASLDVLTPRIQQIVRDALPPGYEISFVNSYDYDEQNALASHADAIITGSAKVDGPMIWTAPRLRVIQKWGIGVDRIDLEAAAFEGVSVAFVAAHIFKNIDTPLHGRLVAEADRVVTPGTPRDQTQKVDTVVHPTG